MSKKSAIIAIFAIIIVAGGATTAGYFLWWAPNHEDPGTTPETPSWKPSEATPSANLTFVKGSEEINISLSTIVEMIDNGSLSRIEFNETDGETSIPFVGINPVYLYDMYGWGDVQDVSFEAADGYSKTINASDIMLTDPDFNRAAVGNPTVLAIIGNGQWLKTYDASYGDFALRGTSLSSGQRVKNIIKLTYETMWSIKIIQNDAIIGTLSSENFTVANLPTAYNLTTYEWGYTDNATDYSFGPSNYTGVTIASIMTDLGIGGTNYNVSFSAIDGYGTNWSYNTTDVETGLTDEKCEIVNTDNVTLSNQGKQMMLCHKENNNILDHDNGPLRVIIPGASKKYYIRMMDAIVIES